MKKIWFFVIINIFYLFGTSLVYIITKDSYLKVGTNNGSIETRMEIISKIKKVYHSEIISCQSIKKQKLNNLIKIKTSQIMFFKDKTKKINLCYYF